ncbi:hypothetical protein GF345_05070 [Candidatus Woesearchaeota archaeon]|nr:hypothetical protein [Candidatus Woesearchaeota archaeon]
MRKRPSIIMALMIVILLLMLSTGCQESDDKDEEENFSEDQAAEENTGGGADESVNETGDEEPQENETSDVADDEDDAEPEPQPDPEPEYELVHTLADIDEIFQDDFFFIVGNQAPAMDVVTISEIQVALRDLDIQTGTAELADEVDDISAKNYIVVGNPCDNPAAAELMSDEIEEQDDCNVLESGTAQIRLFKTSPDSIAILVSGDRPVYTRIAGDVLGNFDEYPLTGTAVEIRGPADNPSLNLIE